ncbi:hypothetical protein IMCC1989_1140 [gamma proteobacterium IMCC1989]|nr:hypothetical protein IMCC1989_1140 [gamma proteobacterium IMCC1989]
MVEKIAVTTSYGASATSIVAGLSSAEWSVVGIVGGLIIGVATFFVNLWFKLEQLKIDRERSKNSG